MTRCRLVAWSIVGVAALAVPGTAQQPAFTPRFEAVAETRLLMEGLAGSNYKSLNKILKDRPADNETWSFARGQAILVAETGNLLLLRPPRNTGRDTWMRLAMEMRTAATQVAREAAARDHPRAKAAMTALTAACNRCHTTFRVPVKVAPQAEAGERDARADFGD